MIYQTEHIHRMKYDGRRKKPRNSRQTRMLLGSRLKVMLADLGLTPDSAAQALHVTPRTVRYWISGKTLVPYAAYRLLRIMAGAELPCPGWDGWHMHSGKLWSPEGHGFLPSDSSWWGHLVRKARLFKELYDRETQLTYLLARAGRAPTAGEPGPTGAGSSRAASYPTGEAGRAAQPAGLNLSLRHFGAYMGKNEERRGFQPGQEKCRNGENQLVETNKTGTGVASWTD